MPSTHSRGKPTAEARLPITKVKSRPEGTEENSVSRPSKRVRTNEVEVTNQAEGSDEEDEEEVIEEKKDPSRAADLYLDTVNRTALDFDFEKVCSVCVSNINIYGCLICGKYFQGRGPSSYAYAHSIHDDHHVFINLETAKVYVLPDNYLVSDPSLSDIVAVLSPRFSPSDLKALDQPLHLSRPSFDLANNSYLRGFIGLNNIKRHDHINVIIHMLLHVPPLRDFLLLYPDSYVQSMQQKSIKNATKDVPRHPELLLRLSLLTRKLWSSRLFKSQVSPHEFLQEVNRASKSKWRLEEQGDPAEFLGWLLNKLHIDLGGTRKKGSSVIYTTFQGELRAETQQVIVRPEEGTNQKPRFDIARDIKTVVSPFLYLAVDLPPPPLFQDSIEKNIIPQISLASVLSKYDGHTTQESLGQLKRYKLQRLPPYIILHYKRFTTNNFVEEKNPTIINFPLRGVDFREYLDAPPNHPPTVYDLLSNVTHESVAGITRDKANTVWKIHLRAGGGGGDGERWYEVQDLMVQEVRKEMIFLGESVLQVWQRRDSYENSTGKTQMEL
ncbi:spindle pole body protein [Hysterangium stoloniferum]|nr:spindle pole body protein [Hysterangium stoloniferum]